jgi:putative ABC transport system ATP-binding protein
MDENRSLLKLVGVSRIFSMGSVDEVAALDNINLDVNAGEFVTLIGSNGAGKTTLLNVISGVYPPERGGRLIINSNDVTNLSECKHARYVGRVYQDPDLGTAAKLTIEENLAIALLRGRQRRLRAASNKHRREQFHSALAMVGLGLEDRLNAPVGTLSGGQRQALALVMATINRPAILLLDEHTASLDPKTASTILELTEMLVNSENLTTLMVTHNMELALRYGNRLVMMHQGRIVLNLNHEQKSNLTIADLVERFEMASGERFADDSMLLVSKEDETKHR